VFLILGIFFLSCWLRKMLVNLVSSLIRFVLHPALMFFFLGILGLSFLEEDLLVNLFSLFPCPPGKMIYS